MVGFFSSGVSSRVKGLEFFIVDFETGFNAGLSLTSVDFLRSELVVRISGLDANLEVVIGL